MFQTGQPSDVHDRITHDRNLFIATWKNTALYRKYASGEQGDTLTDEQKQMLRGVLKNTYCDNACGQIVEEHSSRLEFERVEITSPTEREWAQRFQALNSIEDTQAFTHQNVVLDGNYTFLLEWDEESKRCVIHQEPWWDGTQGMFCAYGPGSKMVYAVNEWRTITEVRRVIYIKGWLSRFRSRDGGSQWESFLLPEDEGGVRIGDVYLVPNQDGSGAWLPVPVVHFIRPCKRFKNYGLSVLDGGVIGAQDQINDLQYDISAAARMTGYQMTWSKGYQLKKNIKTGKPIPPRVGPGVHHHAEEPEAEWGRIEAGDIGQLISTYEHKLKSLCRMTRTPFHIIVGVWPSGEAIYRAEFPIVKMSERVIASLKSKWIEVFHRAMEIENVFGQKGLNEENLLSCKFKDPSNRDPITVALADQALWTGVQHAVEAGVDLDLILAKLGWSEADIEKNNELRKKRQEEERKLAQEDADLQTDREIKIAKEKPQPLQGRSTPPGNKAVGQG